MSLFQRELWLAIITRIWSDLMALGHKAGCSSLISMRLNLSNDSVWTGAVLFKTLLYCSILRSHRIRHSGVRFTKEDLEGEQSPWEKRVDQRWQRRCFNTDWLKEQNLEVVKTASR